MAEPIAALAMQADLPAKLFGPAQLDRLRGLATVDPAAVLDSFDTDASRLVLRSVEVLITGWGCPAIDAAVLAAAPELRAIIHAGGSVKGHVSQECWDRGVLVSTAADANAQPVAEYTVGLILLANKVAWRASRLYRQRRAFIDREAEFTDAGNYGRTVGIIGASRTGRRVIELLRPYQIDILVTDPFVDEAEAAALGVGLVELDELLTASDVVSVHAPALPSTRHLLDRRRLALLSDGATLINTARGSLIDQQALIDELSTGRIEAMLDVTEPEVLSPDSPLYTLPNVFLTPHIAGAMGYELHRLGASALDELARYAAGEPLRHAVDAAHLWRIA